MFLLYFACNINPENFRSISLQRMISLYSIHNLFFIISLVYFYLNCLYVYIYVIIIFTSFLFIYFIVFQLYPTFCWLMAKIILLWIVFRQYFSCFIEFLIIMVNILQMGCLKLTKLYDND